MPDPLLNSIHSFINDAGSATFGDLATALFRRQYELNEPYSRFVSRSGFSAESIARWQDIPAAPATAFKAFDLTCTATDEAVAMFQSSGTTGANASRHWMDSDALGLYEHSLRTGYNASLPAQPIWAVMPPPNEAPNSSLTHMLAALNAEKFFWDDWATLSVSLTTLTHPVTLFGTGFAFVALFESAGQQTWPLPTGSVVVNTGGFKGRTREVPRGEFYSQLRSRFHVADSQCVAEYGMSEMASQFYSIGEDGVFRAPHWLRSLVIDPATGEPVADGEEGLLRHFDLANWNSVAAIQTQDLAIADGDGFRLIGRAPDAEVRGCSLTVEELWTRH